MQNENENTQTENENTQTENENAQLIYTPNQRVIGFFMGAILLITSLAIATFITGLVITSQLQGLSGKIRSLEENKPTYCDSMFASLQTRCWGTLDATNEQGGWVRIKLIGTDRDMQKICSKDVIMYYSECQHKNVFVEAQ